MIGTIIEKGEKFNHELYRECANWCTKTQLGIIVDKGDFFEVINNPFYEDPEVSRIKADIQMFKDKLSDLDYIGTKIATGRATREEYKKEIEKMNEYADQINRLEEELKKYDG